MKAVLILSIAEMDTRYAFDYLSGLEPDARQAVLRDLESDCEGSTTLRQVIGDLRKLGHDLWSFDEDGEGSESWCADWTMSRPGQALALELQDGKVTATWTRDIRFNDR